jgi:hypothetical protein
VHQAMQQAIIPGCAVTTGGLCQCLADVQVVLDLAQRNVELNGLSREQR